MDRKRWDRVSHGDQVELRLDGFRIHRGDVDEASNEGDFVWVFISLGERRLFHKDDGYELIHAPHNLGSELIPE